MLVCHQVLCRDMRSTLKARPSLRLRFEAAITRLESTAATIVSQVHSLENASLSEHDEVVRDYYATLSTTVYQAIAPLRAAAKNASRRNRSTR